MRKISTSLIGLTAALTLTLVACGDDDGTGVDSGDPLTADEVAAVLAALGSALAEAGPAGAQAAGAQVPISVTEIFDITFPCVEGGNIVVSGGVSGTFDNETGDSDLATTVTWDPNACVVSTDNNTFTVDGTPHIELAFDLTTTQDGFTADGTETGGFSYTSSDGRSGGCSFDVTYSIVATETSIDATISGTICGQNATAFETLGA
jgi:hypothetical protein